MTLEDLNATHALPHHLSFFSGPGDLPFLQVRNAHAEAVVSLYGAQVLSYRPVGAEADVLFLSERASFEAGKAIRGGVPVCWPWFGPDPQGLGRPNHGFARTRLWSVLNTGATPASETQVTLGLRDTPATRALWPHGFRLELTVSLGGPRLDLELYAENTGDTSWDFAAALHTYLAVSELSHVRLQGLEGCRYQDRLLGGTTLEDHPEKRFHGEIDRIYNQVPDLLLRDGPRRLSLRSHNFEDAVLWNPGPEKCAALKDMPADGWQHMLCVEAARIQAPPTLQPGESWAGLHTLVLEGAE